VLKYLARYTHRVAITNGRLMNIDEGRVTFYWKNYAQGHAQQIMVISANEFLRRFLLHVLPSGFVKIRHFGILSNRHRTERIARARQLMVQAYAKKSERCQEMAARAGDSPGIAVPARCPACKMGRLLTVEIARSCLAPPAHCLSTESGATPHWADTS
jgi:hypothetical protein